MTSDSGKTIEQVAETPTTEVLSSDPPSDSNKPLNKKLFFDNVVDLQTRLVLLPLNEEEGCGAVVASFIPRAEPTKEKPMSTDSSTRHSEDEKKADDEEQDSESTKDDLNETDFGGCILVGINAKEGEIQSWKQIDYSSIFTHIRSLEGSIEILLECPSKNPQAETTTTTKAESLQHQQQEDEESTQHITSSIMALSKWGSRMRATSAQFAAEAASSAATLSSVVAVAASEAKERARANMNPSSSSSQSKDNATTEQDTTGPVPNMFLQTSAGAMFPISSSPEQGRTSEYKVTTSSLIYIRLSAADPCPPSLYSFQWYRSGNSAHSGDIISDCGSTAGSKTGNTVEWIPLVGANCAVFQPNATLVGRRLRCIITSRQEESMSDSDTSYTGDDLNSESGNPQQWFCDLDEVISADLTLFNGARQALVRGAKFGGLIGRGAADGRMFRIEVALAVSKKKRKVLSAVKISLVTSTSAELLNENPILQVSAHADASKPKQFDLLFPEDALEVTPLLSALCQDGRLSLEAPNKWNRESFLLTLGIANFNGKPADLDATTILYHDQSVPTKTPSLDDDSTAASSVASSVPEVAVVSPMPTPVKVQVSPIPDRSSVISEDGVTYHGKSLDRFSEMEEEIKFLRSKLDRKEKVVTELQRQITKSDALLQKTRQTLVACQKNLKDTKVEGDDARHKLREAEKKIQSYDANILRLQGDHAMQISNLENKIMSQSDHITELEKTNRSLQNDKAVLNAAVEAREAKLEKMSELQESCDSLSQRLVQQQKLQVELNETTKRYETIQQDLEKVSQFEQQCRQELARANESVDNLTRHLKDEQQARVGSKRELELLQKRVHQLKAERNSFKQKADSLSKEISRICRNGRTMRDIERIIAEEEVRREEVEELRKQKRKALEEAHQYRTSYEQSKIVSDLSAADYESKKLLQRNVELERMVSEMTEYVDAKEMQLETIKQVNEALQDEIKNLAIATMEKNEV